MSSTLLSQASLDIVDVFLCAHIFVRLRRLATFSSIFHELFIVHESCDALFFSSANFLHRSKPQHFSEKCYN